MLDTPVYLIARGSGPEEVGHAKSLYWGDHQKLMLAPLANAEAGELLEACIERFNLGALDLTGFREAILAYSRHNPEALVEMCKLAAEPRYHYGSQVKVRTLRIDYLMSRNCRNPQSASARSSA